MKGLKRFLPAVEMRDISVKALAGLRAMRNFLFKLYLLSAVLGILIYLHPFPAAAESAVSLVESGNQAFAEGNYAAALEKYKKASGTKPDSAIVLFNQGAALYKQEKYDAAMHFFEQASEKALADNNRVLEAQSRYNLGNSSYRLAEKLLQQDPNAALTEFKKSGAYFESALEIDPGFTDAAQNLEVSRIAAKQVEELIRRQQQKVQQQNKLQQEMAKELANLQKEQQQAAANSQKTMQAEQQNENERSLERQRDQLTESQKSLTGRTKQAEQKLAGMMQDMNEESPNETARNHLRNAIEKQEKAGENLQQKNLSDALQNQQAASLELQEALEKLEQDQAKTQQKVDSGQRSQGTEEKQQTENMMENAQQNQDDAEGDQQKENSPVASDNLEEISPEDIISEEMENKKYRSVRGRTGYEPVEKDW